MTKKVLNIAAAVLLAVVMTACGNKSEAGKPHEAAPADIGSAGSGIDLRTDGESGDKAPEEKVSSEKASSERASGENGPADEPEGRIAEQTFDVALDGWGQVTFASFLPEKNERGDGDVRFKLLKDGKTVYAFPGVAEDNTRFDQQFVQVEAVAFKDYDDDGRTDVIIINEYRPLSGDSGKKTYNEVRVYLQKAGGDGFYIDSLLDEFLMKNYYNDSIASVMSAKNEYRDYKASLDGSRSIQSQTAVIAAHMDQWFEDPELAGDVCRYAVTDLDRNGRLEVIVSHFGGTGLYTYSRFFEVAETYDGLTECETNFMEGDSQADIMVDSTFLYEDSAGVCHYIFTDLLRAGAAAHYEGIRAITLKNRRVEETPLALCITQSDGDSGATVTYENAAQEEITETEFLSAADTAFAGCIKKIAAFGWQDMGELKSLERNEVIERLEASYGGFIVDG